jgi:hypothetical protein
LALGAGVVSGGNTVITLPITTGTAAGAISLRFTNVNVSTVKASSYTGSVATQFVTGTIAKQGTTATSAASVVATTADATNSTISVAPGVVQDTYVTNSTMTITARDTYNNLVSGITVGARITTDYTA